MASQAQKYLPEDILVNIFYRVGAVESLIRCRCVCKAWHQMISATSFVAAHLAYQKTSSNKYLLYDGCILSCSLFSNFESFFDGTYRNYKLLYYPLELFYRGDTFCGPNIYGICNGLLCLSNMYYRMGDNIYLYNPGCRKIRKLPELDISTRLDDGGLITENVPGVSFGYYDDDYKVVVFAPVGNVYTIYVYSLGNNCWKHIHTNYTDNAKRNYVFLSLDTKFVHNTVYASTNALVICFDLSDETVRVVKFPTELFCYHKTLEAYEETIAVFDYENNPPQSSLNMWILRRDKFPSWEKKSSFELQKVWDDDVQGVGILDNGKYLVRTRNDARGLITLDLEDFLKLKEFRCMHAARDQLLYRDGRIHFNYVESLLLLNEDSPVGSLI